jgi:hypothetical protein
MHGQEVSKLKKNYLSNLGLMHRAKLDKNADLLHFCEVLERSVI